MFRLCSGGAVYAVSAWMIKPGTAHKLDSRRSWRCCVCISARKETVVETNVSPFFGLYQRLATK